MKSLSIAVLVTVIALVMIGVPQWSGLGPDEDPAALNQRGLACYFGDGAKKDLAKARGYFQQAAGKGYAPAQVNLGTMYDHGDGMPRDYRMAKYWYQKAADQGEPTARQMLGYLYLYGLGVEPDHKKAMYYFVAAHSEIKGDAAQAAELSRLVTIAAR
jgi:TPR repeat protein